MLPAPESLEELGQVAGIDAAAHIAHANSFRRDADGDLAAGGPVMARIFDEIPQPPRERAGIRPPPDLRLRRAKPPRALSPPGQGSRASAAAAPDSPPT